MAARDVRTGRFAKPTEEQSVLTKLPTDEMLDRIKHSRRLPKQVKDARSRRINRQRTKAKTRREERHTRQTFNKMSHRIRIGPEK
jgi:hypothetical protein